MQPADVAKVAFRLQQDPFRKDDTPVHEAIREALANALIHADYCGQGGVVVERNRARIEMSNPGDLLVSYQQLVRGGISECRNKSLQLMFQMLGLGEKAGSGIDRIRLGWETQGWWQPEIEETVQPDRVRLVMPLEGMVPSDVQARLHGLFRERIGTLGPLELQTLATAEREGRVSNSRLRLISDEHPADLTKMLQSLVVRGFLEQVGQKRGCSYVLSTAPRLPLFDEASHLASVAPHTSLADSTHNGVASHVPGIDSTQSEGTSHVVVVQVQDAEIGSETEADAAMTHEVVIPAGARRLPLGKTRLIVLKLCQRRYLAAKEIAGIMHRNAASLAERTLRPMVREGALEMRYPSEPTRPDQAYRTTTHGEQELQP